MGQAEMRHGELDRDQGEDHKSYVFLNVVLDDFGNRVFRTDREEIGSTHPGREGWEAGEAVLSMADDEDADESLKREMLDDGFAKTEREAHKNWIKAKFIDLIQNEGLHEEPKNFKASKYQERSEIQEFISTIHPTSLIASQPTQV